jgi:ribosomal protein S18 acetylase RimI-like enzyme
MDISLRKQVDTDLIFIKRLFDEVKSYELNAGQWQDELRKQILDMQFSAHELHFKNNLSNGEDSIILFEGNPVGRLILDRSDNDINLADIIILPEYQGKGIGKFVIEKIINESDTSGKTITLIVSKNNRAMNLYSKLGFKISHQTETDYCMIYSSNRS